MKRACHVPAHIAVTLVLAAALGTFAPVAHSACAAPELHLRPVAPYAPGDTIRVQGLYWTGGCQDVIMCTQGYLGTKCPTFDPAAPARNIVISLREVDGGAATEVVLAKGIDASTGFRFSVEVTLPTVPGGRYQLVADSPDTGERPSEPFRVAA